MIVALLILIIGLLASILLFVLDLRGVDESTAARAALRWKQAQTRLEIARCKADIRATAARIRRDVDRQLSRFHQGVLDE